MAGRRGHASDTGRAGQRRPAGLVARLLALGARLRALRAEGVLVGAATDPEAPTVTIIDGYMVGLSKRSFQVA